MVNDKLFNFELGVNLVFHRVQVRDKTDFESDPISRRTRMESRPFKEGNDMKATIGFFMKLTRLFVILLVLNCKYLQLLCLVRRCAVCANFTSSTGIINSLRSLNDEFRPL